MKGYNVNIEEETIKNEDYRRVVYTGNYMQLVFMRLAPGESIGLETHGNDQFFRFEKGNGEVVIDDTVHKVTDGSGVVVPAGAKHNVTNTSTVEELHLYTIYAGPHHKDGIKFATKAAADASSEEFDGKTTE